MEIHPHAELAAVGYAAQWHGQKTYHGVALLTRGPAATDVVKNIPGLADEQARVIAGTVDGPLLRGTVLTLEADADFVVDTEGDVIVQGNLLLRGAGAFALTDPGNNVATLAASSGGACSV